MGKGREGKGGTYWSNSSQVYNSQRKNAISTEQKREREETVPQRNTQHHQHGTRALNKHHRYAKRTDHLGFVCVQELRGVLNGCEEG